MISGRELATSMLLIANSIAGCSTISADAPDTPATTAPGLPSMKRFQIGGDVYGPVTDCQISDYAVKCTSTWTDPYQADTYTGTFSGTFSGLVLTGVSTTHQTGHDADDPSCRWETETSAPLTYTFRLDGTVSNRQDPGQWRMTKSGSCSGTESGTSSSSEGGLVRWAVIE